MSLLSHPINVDALITRCLHFEVESGYKQNEEDLAFEAWVADYFGKKSDKHFYAWVAGVTFSNEDGSSRQSLIQRCQPHDRISLLREPQNPHGVTAIAVLNSEGRKLGYLKSSTSVDIAPQIDGGCEWMAVVRRLQEEPILGPPRNDYEQNNKMYSALLLCLLRAAEEDPDNELKKLIVERTGMQADKLYSAKIIRYFGRNLDGSDRQELIAKCERGDLLSLIREQEMVRVSDMEGRALGYLEPWRATLIASVNRPGYVWKALVSEKLVTPGGRRRLLGIVLFRVPLKG